MKLTDIKNHLETQLKYNLKTQLPRHPFTDIYLYSVLPPGKLFRPFLAISVLHDFAAGEKSISPTSPHSFFCSAVEIHHAYTLVHDDLPCMDNDDYRRGRPTVHKAFGEWKALLAGDGLINASYGLLAQIDSPNLSKLLKFFTWAVGPKGLIQGQVLDLSEEMRKDFSTLLSTHEYKTARLIQVALCGSYLLLEKKKNSLYTQQRQFLDIFKLGYYTGVTFQLLDDLTELTDKNISEHEKSINPWFYFPEESLSFIHKGLETIKKISEKHQMLAFHLVMKDYFGKIHTTLNDNLETVATHQKKSVRDLVPMMSLLERLAQ